MSFFKKLIRKKKEEKAIVPQEVKKTELEELCGDDKEIYEALYDTMPPDPRRSNKSIEELVQEARKFENSGDMLRAKGCYHIAGGLAIYEGNIEKVKEYFGKCQKLSGKKYKILENPEKAVAKAQEYYKKYLP